MGAPRMASCCRPAAEEKVVDETTPLVKVEEETVKDEVVDEEDWKVGFAESTPLPPVLWGWTMNIVLLAVQTWMVIHYAPDAKDLAFECPYVKVAVPVWGTYVAIQIVCLAYSWVTVNYIFPSFPTICGLPFFLLGFFPAFVIVAAPFAFTDLGWEMAKNAPLSVLTAWSAVRLMFESIVQLHANYGVKGISYWLLWPIQKAPEPYTLTYPFIGPVTRTNGGNVYAFSSLCLGLPVAIIFFSSTMTRPLQ